MAELRRGLKRVIESGVRKLKRDQQLSDVNQTERMLELVLIHYEYDLYAEDKPGALAYFQELVQRENNGPVEPHVA